ncbi:MAG: hypothetical protein H0W87_05925 [Actinobacteria bacterium]|nr:hypothetical protein [Actinomycetota bacterium]
MNRVQLAGIGILGAILTIVGAIGTWATGDVLKHAVAGTDANRGKTVAIAAGVALVLLAVTAWKGLRWTAILAAIAGLVSFGLTVWTLSNINKFVGDDQSQFAIGKGWGIWVATIGSLVLVLAALLAAFMKERAARVEAPAAPPAGPPAGPPA